MVKVVQANSELPPEWEEFWNKVARWYNIRGIPTFARIWSQNMRRMKQIRYTISDFKRIGTAWSNLSPADQKLWRDAAQAAWEYNRGYRLFTADYLYRLIAGLSVPGTPSSYHQLFGLQMKNPGGSELVQMRRDDKDLVGELTYKFNYTKTEVAADPPNAFKVFATAYYYTEGGTATETDSWTAPAGHVVWNEIERTFGTVDRKYFHFKIILAIHNYDAKVYFNDLILSDKNGKYFSENWITSRNTPWVPTLLWRKRDWIFSPGYITDFFNHLYLT